ncbi:MAG: Outer rane immunogenic protein [Tardiphaga sp.]|jgi:outer membrane immunogenic protein|nr:Outer rane immunogenic protein [Tardiphaga sp.]
MNKLLVTTAALLSFATIGSAVAADLPAAPVYKAPVAVAQVYNWTGFYLGGNIGYGWGRSATTVPLSDPIAGIVSSSNPRFDLNGVIGGGQFGYNWQVTNWVFSLEADIQGSGQRGGTTTSCAGGAVGGTTLAALSSACSTGHVGDTAPFNTAALPVTDSLSQKLEWFGTVRGRIGPTVTPTLLPYLTGGLAYGRVSTSGTVSGTNITGPQGTNVVILTPVSGSFSNGTTRVGWTVGAGLEGAVSGNWTAKIEYLYVDLGTVSGSFVTPIVTTSGAFLTSTYRSHITDNILRVGFNYKFDTSGPMLARY